MRQVTAGAIAATILFSAPVSAQAPISCEGWLEIHNQTGKLASEINTWIIKEIRGPARQRALKDHSTSSCANYDCMKDSEILAAVSDTCARMPARSLSDGISNADMLLLLEAGDKVRSKD